MGEVFLVRDRITGAQCAPQAPECARGAFRATISSVSSARSRGCVIPRSSPSTNAASLRTATPISRWNTFRASRSTKPSCPATGAARARRLGDRARARGSCIAASILHGDLKPSNVLATATGDRRHPLLNLRLVDFGLSATLGEGGATHRGSPGYAAPEVVRAARRWRSHRSLRALAPRCSRSRAGGFRSAARRSRRCSISSSPRPLTAA